MKALRRHHAHGGKRVFQIAQIEQHRHAGGFGAIDESSGKHGGIDQTILRRGETIAAAARADERDALFLDTPVPERRSDDDLIQSDDGQNADFFAAQLLGRADAAASDDAVGVFVEVGADDNNLRARKIGGDVRLRSDDVELDFTARQRVRRLGAAPKEDRFEIETVFFK